MTEAEDKKDKKGADEERAPFLSHLNELRRRIVRSMLAVLVGFLVCWFFKEPLFQVLAAPVLKVLRDQNIQLLKSTAALGPFLQSLVHTGIAPKLQVLHPAEAFFAFLKVALLGGVTFAVPVIFYQLWRFVSPGLYSKERRMVLPFMGAGTICFVAGVLFCYFLVLPFGLSFLANFGGEYMDYRPAVAPYLSFVVRLTFAFGLVFELPVILFFFGRIGLITSKQLSRFRKFAILLAFILAAILTPPDVFTQLLMAGPILMLYEVSIVLVRVAEKRKKAAQTEAEAEFR